MSRPHCAVDVVCSAVFGIIFVSRPKCAVDVVHSAVFGIVFVSCPQCTSDVVRPAVLALFLYHVRNVVDVVGVSRCGAMFCVTSVMWWMLLVSLCAVLCFVSRLQCGGCCW